MNIPSQTGHGTRLADMGKENPGDRPEWLGLFQGSLFEPGAIPELSTSRATAAQIDRCFAFLRSPDLPTDFD